MATWLYKTADILEDPSDVLVNPVNTRGVMGKGLALAFKKKYPEMYEKYVQRCTTGILRIGMIHTHSWIEGGRARTIVNLPTKDHFKDPSTYAYVEQGLIALRDWLIGSEPHVKSIAIPPLGCGLGGLDWTVVKPLIHTVLDPLPSLSITLYEPTQST